MGLTVSTLTPAIEKAKNVATESYVDSTVNTASAALEAAYIEYNNTVKQALIDGEISDAEATAIAAAETKVNDAKTLLNATIVTASNTALSNANAYTNSAISGSGFVLPSGVAAAVNSNTTTINGSKITTGSIAAAQIAAGTITSNKISTYNLTAANSTFENGIITNAKIADASINTAKIGDLSVSTLKIQDEAVVVPRSASGGYSCSIYYVPAVSHAASILGEWVQGSGRNRAKTSIYINDTLVRTEIPISGTLCAMFYNTYLYAGVVYTITLNTERNEGDMSCRLLLLGTKR